MERELIKKLLLEQHKLELTKGVVNRDLSEKISNFGKMQSIIILSGIRRCGKSTLMQELRLKHKESYYVNFDDERFINFSVNDFQQMYELLLELFGDRNIFFFDEIQNIANWERFARRMHDSGKKIYITGSNASMLSKELGTHLTGRNIPFTLYPFSFREFLRFNKITIDHNKLTTPQKSTLKRYFNYYIEKGGFPEYLISEKEEYLKSVYENILYRDIITRYNLPNEKAVKEVVYYAASNIGKEISFNSLRKITNLTSATTIREYFEYLENSYLLFLIPRYSESLKKQMYYNKKVYLIDTAMVRILGFRTSKDAGRMLENTVFLELKRKGLEVYFHKDKYECDFLIRNGPKIVEAIQVSYELKANREREINGLLEALNQYKLNQGLILTEDEEDEIVAEKKKITIKPIWKWLLEQK